MVPPPFIADQTLNSKMKSILALIASLAVSSAVNVEEAAYLKIKDYSKTENNLRKLGYDEKTAR